VSEYSQSQNNAFAFMTAKGLPLTDMKLKMALVGLAAAALMGWAVLAEGNGRGRVQVVELGPEAKVADVSAQAVGSVKVPYVTYFVNALSGDMSFLLFYNLQAGHVYQVDGTSDAINYTPLYTISTLANTSDVQLNYSVNTSECSVGLWPRITEVQ